MYYVSLVYVFTLISTIICNSIEFIKLMRSQNYNIIYVCSGPSLNTYPSERFTIY